MHGMWRGFWWFGDFWPFILAVLLIYILFKLFKNRQGEYYTRRETALEILQKRYAAGEISKAEYLEIKEELR